MEVISLVSVAAGLFGAPLLLGIINRTKALVAGRRGQPLLQLYFDLSRLLRKGATYSVTTSWVFRAGPVVGLAAILTALLLMPLGHNAAVLAFPGDVIVFAYLLGLARFFTMNAALDTGSAFEGLGAGREAHYGALAEPALFLALAALAFQSGAWSLSSMLSGFQEVNFGVNAVVFTLVALVLLVVVLTENCRVPVDDPNTHLELTMIHEVLVLDHSGPDLAFILYGAALKLWVLGGLLVGVINPFDAANPWIELSLNVAGLGALAVVIGLIESSMARLRLIRVPRLLAGASVLAAVALTLAAR